MSKENKDHIEQLLDKTKKNETITFRTEQIKDLNERLDDQINVTYNEMKQKEMHRAEFTKEETLKDFDYLNDDLKTSDNKNDQDKIEQKDIEQDPPKLAEEEKIEYVDSVITEEQDFDFKKTSEIEKIIVDNQPKENQQVNQSNQVFDKEGSSFNEYKQEKSMNPTIIEFKDIFLQIEREKILNGINLKIHEGEFVYFVGISGAGKSSMIKLIYRELKGTEGELIVLGSDVNKLKRKKLPELRRKVGVIFQDYKLLEDKTIYDNVKFSLEVIGYPRKDRKEQVLKVLKKVGLTTHKDKYPNELSGGQQQRAAIARAIVADPEIIVCDEPTGNLDPENAIGIMEILMDIHKSGTTILMATHDVGIVNRYKKRVVRIKDGKIVNQVYGGYIYE